MIITYRDKLGTVIVESDYEEIDFLDGFAFFSVNGEEYNIKIDQLVRIEKY